MQKHQREQDDRRDDQQETQDQHKCWFYHQLLCFNFVRHMRNASSCNLKTARMNVTNALFWCSHELGTIEDVHRSTDVVRRAAIAFAHECPSAVVVCGKRKIRY